MERERGDKKDPYRWFPCVFLTLCVFPGLKKAEDEDDIERKILVLEEIKKNPIQLSLVHLHHSFARAGDFLHTLIKEEFTSISL